MSDTVQIAIYLPLSSAAYEPVPPADVWNFARRVVAGNVQCVYLTDPEPDAERYAIGWHLEAWVNEDGIAQGQPLNRTNRDMSDGFYGPIVLVRARIDSEGEMHFRDIAPSDVALFNERFPLMAIPKFLAHMFG